MADKLQFKKGDVIFKQNDFDTQMYIVKSGSVEIIVDYGKESEKILTTVGVEGIFGELGLVDYMPRTATAVAAQDCELDMIDQNDFAEVMKGNPDLMYRVLKSITDRIDSLSKEYEACCKEIGTYYADEKQGKGTFSEKLKALVSFGRNKA